MSKAPASIDGPLLAADGIPLIESLRMWLRRRPITRAGSIKWNRLTRPPSSSQRMTASRFAAAVTPANYSVSSIK
jgi:hypothetical protein